VNASWKVAKDAFQEVYHISTLHHKTLVMCMRVKQIPMRMRSTLRSFPRTAGFRCRLILTGSQPRLRHWHSDLALMYLNA
jgi:hypothetical protein